VAGDYSAERAIVERWNESLNQRDTNRLQLLYGNYVLYYGTHLASRDCLIRVNAALAKEPAYHQDILFHDIEKFDDHDERVTIFFTKRTGGKSYNSYIVVDRIQHRIVEEGDRVTDRHLVEAGKCFSHYSNLTLSGRVIEGSVPYRYGMTVGTFLELDRAVCLIGFDDKDAGNFVEPEAPRTESVGLRVSMVSGGEIPASLVGKRVSVAGHWGARPISEPNRTDTWFYADTIALEAK
jgi:hypothetical protein